MKTDIVKEFEGTIVATDSDTKVPTDEVFGVSSPAAQLS